ncbi:MAG: sodium:solute symporter [Verrucomicrobiota bacterium]
MDPFIYNFVCGGAVFVFGLVLAWRQGSLGLSGKGLRNLCLALGVFSFYFILQAFLQYKAPGMPAAEPAAYRPTPASEAAVDPEQSYRGAPVDYAIMIGYFAIIVVMGAYFGRKMKSTEDFFFGGRKFAWWLIAFSMIATTIGSYSFLKYSSKGYEYGLSSTQTYSNDWFYFPLLLFCWLPILYFSRVTSIPEYFGKRFNSKVRFWATVCLMLYMIGYVGVNLYTMGKVLHHLLGWDIFVGAVIVALVSMSYVSSGGQTSVIMTDLFQGVMLLVTGGLILGLGFAYLGGFDVFWDNLPGDSRKVFHNFNSDPGFPSVGIFWQDGLANSIMFGFLHQGTIMRYMSARSFKDCKKAVVTHLVVLMPLAACVVGGAGWLAKALANHGDLPSSMPADESFYAATQLISQPGIFGLILAAMIAALMSTVDTLITAISAVWVNDVHKLYIKKDMTDRQALTVARLTAIGATVVGIILVPVFMNFDSIYDAHGAFTAAVTPPLVVTFIFSVFWKRFTAPAALATLVVGLFAIAFSFFVPEVITPFAHGVPMGEAGDGLFAGVKQYKFMRACYGLTICAVVGVVVSFFTRPETKSLTGLVWEKSFYRSLKTD